MNISYSTIYLRGREPCNDKYFGSTYFVNPINENDVYTVDMWAAFSAYLGANVLDVDSGMPVRYGRGRYGMAVEL